MCSVCGPGAHAAREFEQLAHAEPTLLDDIRAHPVSIEATASDLALVRVRGRWPVFFLPPGPALAWRPAREGGGRAGVHVRRAASFRGVPLPPFPGGACVYSPRLVVGLPRARAQDSMKRSKFEFVEVGAKRYFLEYLSEGMTADINVDILSALPPLSASVCCVCARVCVLLLTCWPLCGPQSWMWRMTKWPSGS